MATILFDGKCGFCRRWVSRLLRWDRNGRLRPVALQDPEADELLGDMDEEQRMASWHLVEADGRVYSAGAAFPPLLRLLPGGRPLGRGRGCVPGSHGARVPPRRAHARPAALTSLERWTCTPTCAAS